MKRLRKLLLWVVLPLLLLLVILVFVGNIIISKAVDRDLVAAWIEGDRNCRVELGGIKVKVLGGRVELENLVLRPRDEHADAGTPLDQRPAPALNPTSITIKRATLSAKVGDLLRKQITVRDLTVDGMLVRFFLDDDGEHTLDPLFDPPKVVSGKPNADYEEEKERRDLAKERRKQSPTAEEPLEIDSFNIEELPLPATLDRLRVKNGEIYIKLQKTKRRIRLFDMDLQLTDLDLDPKDLAAHNSAQLEMDGRMTVTYIDKKVEPNVTTTYADLKLHAEGKIAPFDTKTGYLNPDLVTAITIQKGSEIFSLPLIERLASTLETLKRAGLDVSDLEDTLVVDKDTTLKVGWRDGAMRLAEAVPIGLNGHVLTMAEGSWLHTGSNQHEIPAQLTFSQKTSSSALGKAHETLAQWVGPETAKDIGELLFRPVTKGGRIHVPFRSTGDFGSPKVRPDIELVDLDDLLKNEAKDEALDLLKGLLENR